MNKTINQLTNLAEISSNDELPIWDNSAGDTKKVSIENLGKEIIKEFNTYSTTEHFTGKYWTDGKPIYEKTFTNSWGSSGGTQRVDLDITALGIGSIIKGEGIMDGNSSLGRGFYPMTFMRASSSGSANAFSWGINQTKSTLFFVIQGDGLSTKMYECTFTLNYTKSTT